MPKKKFDTISPKKISEKKFYQLVESLPPSNFDELADQETGEFNRVQPAQMDEALNPISNSSEQKKEKEGFVGESLPQQIGNDDNSTEISDIFVFECGQLRFGIPVKFVTEITNEFGTISPLSNFIRSCIGTFQYRGRLLPIFDSEHCYLRNYNSELGNQRNQQDNIEPPDCIITIDYNGVMFALTMEEHIGIVEIEIPIKNSKGDLPKSSVEDDMLLEIVGYKDQNLFIFSPDKISKIVLRELKNQIVVDADITDKQNLNEHKLEPEIQTSFMLANIKESMIAIEITKVLEVIEGFEVTPLYKVSDYIRGLINLRGQVLACIDLAKYLGYNFTVIDERNKFIVLHIERIEFALCIDNCVGIENLNPKKFQSSEKVFNMQIHQFFPEFFEEDGLVKLIFKPELFLKEPDLLQYR